MHTNLHIPHAPAFGIIGIELNGSVDTSGLERQRDSDWHRRIGISALNGANAFGMLHTYHSYSHQPRNGRDSNMQPFSS
jgi:hypothetical protein